MNKYIKFPLVLGSVALISGALLATTYQLTKEKIEQGVIDRQTGAINDLFKTIDSKELVEVPTDFASKGVNSIVKVKSEGKDYNCYTITFKDSVGGDEGTVIVALDSDAKLYGLKFVTTGDSYMAKYNDETYIANVIKNDKFDAISGATLTGNDLNKVLKIARDCMGGKEKEPIDILFEDNIATKVEVQKPEGANKKINAIYKVNSSNTIYYVYDVSFKDTFGGDKLNVLYALTGNGSFYKLKIVSGDGYASKFDMATDLDDIADATYTQTDLKTYYEIVKECHQDILLNEVFDKGITTQEDITLEDANTKIKSIKQVVSDSKEYYVYTVEFKDTFGGDKLSIMYVLNDDGTLYTVKILVGDSYAYKYDSENDFDGITHATYTKADINTYYNIVKQHNDTIRAGE